MTLFVTKVVRIWVVATYASLAGPSLVSAQTIFDLKLTQNRISQGGQTSVLLEFKSDQSPWCGVSVDWGNGEKPQDLRLGDDDKKTSPLTLSRTYPSPGTYTITARGQYLHRGLKSAKECEVTARPVQVTVVNPTGEQAVPQRQSSLQQSEVQVSLPTHSQSPVAGKVALVIGNSAYLSRPLYNPVNDARAVAGKLRSLGFSIVVRENLKIKEIGATLREFRSKINPGDAIVFFYAGHGLQVNGINYLPGIDADIQGEEDVALNSLSLNTLLTLLEESKAGVKLLFLDACRDNPFARSFRSGGGSDLGKVGQAPSGTLIHYATRPGSVAADGKKDGNGLYTEHLLRWIDTPNTSIEAMHKRVALGVEQDSKGKQEPWSEGQLKGEFYFSSLKSNETVNYIPPSVITPASDTTVELAFWNSVKDSNSMAELQSYLVRYPKGIFADLATSRIARLNSTKGADSPPTMQPPLTSDTKKKSEPDTGLLIFKGVLDLIMKDMKEK